MAVGKNYKKQNYPVMDLCKVYCACLVAFLHCVEIAYGHELASGFSKCCSQQAVPFFFIVSGFLYALKSKGNSTRNNKDILHFIYSYLIWIIIWSPMVIHRYLSMYNGKSLIYIFLVILRRVFLAGEGVYWYLLVLFEALFIIKYSVMNNKKRILIYFSIVFFILGLWYEYGSSIPLMKQFFSIIYYIFSWTNNVLMKGLPFTLLGYCMCDHINSISKYDDKTLIASYISVQGICLAMYFLGQYSKVYIVFYPILALILFFIAVNHRMNDVYSGDTKILRNFSTFLYLIHTLIIYYIVDPVLSPGGPVLYKFSITIGLSLLIFLIVMKVENHWVRRILMLN